MTVVDQTKFNYSSDWKIDQLVQTGTATVSIPSSTATPAYVFVASLSPAFSGIPIVEGTWSNDGGTTWRQFGDPVLGGGVYLDVTSSQLQVKCQYTPATTIQIRYYVYADKVDY